MHTRSTCVVDTPCEVWSSQVIILLVFSRCGPKLQKYRFTCTHNTGGPHAGGDAKVDYNVQVYLICVKLYNNLMDLVMF